jgi:hypothetical protein
MGNYSNQPEFATSASNYTLDTVNFTTNLNGQAVYINKDTELNVIMANVVPSYENIVQLKDLKGGSFLPIIVDYIVPVATANTVTYIAKGTTFAGGSVSGSTEGTYIVDCPIELTADPFTANGAIKLKVVVNGSATITSIEAVEPSRNPATLGGTPGSSDATHQFKIPANSLGGTHAEVASNNFNSAKITALGLTLSVPATGTSIVTFS